MSCGVISVSKGVLKSWRTLSVEDAEWRLNLRLRSSPAGPRPADAVTAALEELHAAPLSDDLGFIGEWSSIEVDEDVVLSVTECEKFDVVLGRLISLLECRGVSGALTLWTPPQAEPPPPYAAILACRVRLRGSRERLRERRYRWRADPAALLPILEAAKEICETNAPPTASLLLSDGTGSGWFALPLHQDATREVVRHVERGLGASLAIHANGGFRCVQANPTGVVSIVVGHADSDQLDWVEAAGAMTEFLRAHASDTAYAFIMRGWDVGMAMIASDLSDDWPVRATYRPVASGNTAQAFEDLLVPDAFAVQLLGEGHADRLPTGADWHIEQLADGHTLVSHRTPEAWFAAPFVAERDWRRPEDRDVPEVLRLARADFAPLLYTPGSLVAHGFPDMAQD